MSASLRRFSFAPLVFFLLWALWFALPLTRGPALAQWREGLGGTPTEPAPGTSRDADLIRAVYPNVPTGPGQMDRLEGATQTLAALGDKYPDDATICAAHILMMPRFFQARHPGTYTYNPNWSVKRTIVNAPSSQHLQEWFALTAHGAKLEPNNTFWDWSQLIGLIAAHRDSEIWPVLHAASRKTDFDEHYNDMALASLRLAVWRKGVVPPFDQLSYGSQYASGSFYFNEVHEAVRQIDDIASGLHLQNTPQSRKQALEGMRDLVLVARTMRLKSKSVYPSSMGRLMEETALFGGTYAGGTTKPKGRPIPPASLSLYASDSRSLLRFAHDEGRGDIAAQMANEWNSVSIWNRKVGRNMRPPQLDDSPDVTTAQIGDTIGKIILAAIPALLVWALFCSLILRLVPAWRRESVLQPSPLSWLWGTLLGIWALFCLLVPIVGVTSGNPFLRASLTGAILSALAYPRAHLGFTFWPTFFPLGASLLLALWCTVLWHNQRLGKPTLVTRLRGLFMAPDDGISRFDLAPLLLLAANVSAVLLFTLGAIGYIAFSSTDRNYLAWYGRSTPVLLAFIALPTLPLLWHLRTSSAWASFFILARRFAWSQLLFITLTWGALWMFAAPAQKRFDANYNRFLHVGEVQVLRKMIGL